MKETSKKEKEIEELKKEVLGCRKCPLYKTRKNPVFGEGNTNAKIMIIAEAPGRWEDVKGRPFVGAAGKVLDELLESIEIKRKDVFICNVLKCRPVALSLQNRAPSLEEIKACSPYLLRQIKIIKPEIICTLGNYSTAFIFEKCGLKEWVQGISRIHGKVFKIKSPQASLKVIPLYHPAVAVYNAKMKGTLLKDFQVLKNVK